jgi:hypothetical protein
MCDLVARTGRHQQRYEGGCRLIAGFPLLSPPPSRILLAYLFDKMPSSNNSSITNQCRFFFCVGGFIFFYPGPRGNLIPLYLCQHNFAMLLSVEGDLITFSYVVPTNCYCLLQS